MDTVQLLRIAVKQRHFILLFAFAYALNPLINVLSNTLDSASGTQALLLAVIVIGIGVLSLVVVVLALIVLFQLTTALEYSMAGRICLLVLTLLPCINLIVLLTVNANATNTLRLNGVDVGLIGASSRQITALRDSLGPQDPYEQA